MSTITHPAVPFSVDGEHRRFWVGPEPHVLHCHHYNTFLQQTIQDADYLDTTPILVGAAQEVAHHQLTQIFADARIDDVEVRKVFAAEVYRWAGFGTVDFANLSETGGTVHAPTSHYSQSWKTKMGVSNQPVDFFTTGWVAGATAAIFGAPAGSYGSVQSRCISMNAPQNTFTVNQQPAYPSYAPIGKGPLTDRAAPTSFATPVDYEAIYAALTSMNVQGDEAGIIDAFGVYLTNHYANYYNRISFEFVSKMRDRFGDLGVEMAEPLLVEAGHVCAFNTFGGIMTSPEWDALVKPQLSSKIDWVSGMTAAVNALGWGRWSIAEANDGGATFIIENDYESVGYLAGYGPSERPVSYLAQGAAAGIMNLVFVGNVEQKPTFDVPFYQRLFKSGDSFTASFKGHRTSGADVTTIEVSR